jgi:hypothetical protein
MMIPRSVMEKDLKGQEKALTDDINALGKKVSFSVLLRNRSNRSAPFRSNTSRNNSTTLSHSYAILYVPKIIFLEVFHLKVPQFNSAPKQ